MLGSVFCRYSAVRWLIEDGGVPRRIEPSQDWVGAAGDGNEFNHLLKRGGGGGGGKR